jgi:hypothetical protein
MKKPLIGLIGSAVLTFIGIYLRLNAHSMSWPSGGYSFSGPASETDWGRHETAISQIGMALMFAGILIFVATYFYWLFDKKSDK